MQVGPSVAPSPAFGIACCGDAIFMEMAGAKKWGTLLFARPNNLLWHTIDIQSMQRNRYKQ